MDAAIPEAPSSEEAPDPEGPARTLKDGAPMATEGALRAWKEKEGAAEAACGPRSRTTDIVSSW